MIILHDRRLDSNKSNLFLFYFILSSYLFYVFIVCFVFFVVVVVVFCLFVDFFLSNLIEIIFLCLI